MLWLASNNPETTAKTIFLYTDNQSFIDVIKNPKPVSGQYIVKKAHQAAN